MGKFEVSPQAIEQTGQTSADHARKEPADREGTNFMVPDQAIRDLGRTAGEVSGAADLLADAQKETEAEPIVPVPPVDEWTRGRDEALAKRDFCFRGGGETVEIFEELKPRHQRKVMDLANKLIELYGDRGVTARTIGLLKDNDIHRYLREHGGAVMGDAYDEYYLICMGKPLENRQLGGKRESETAYVRYHGRKFRVRNFMDMEAGRSFGGPASLVPRIKNNEWLPTILAIRKTEW